MQSPLRELEVERELSHELRDDLLFLDTPIFIKFDYQKCNFATIRGYAAFLLFCAERRSGGFGGAEPPRVGESQGRLARGHLKGEKKKKRTWPASHPPRDPRARRNEILRSDPLTLMIPIGPKIGDRERGANGVMKLPGREMAGGVVPA